jgi:dihydrofolate synthase/folylpolyglutamate synthase
MRQSENYWRQRVIEVEAALLTRMPENKVRPRLEPTRRVVDLLGSPQKAYRVIHVTGTNGKTSTTRFIERILREHGLRTGRFTSPHLVSLQERIAIDGDPVEDEALVRAWNEIEPILRLVDDELLAADDTRLTYFEVLSILAFVVFADAPIDVLALEVGMGGEWDSTNVADGDVAVFTPIALDHVDRLGHTIEEIATTKSGIIKPGAAVVIGKQRPEALAVLRAKADAIADVRYELERDFSVTDSETLNGAQKFGVSGLAGNYPGLLMPLLGDFQAENAAVAIAAVEAFMGYGQKPISWDVLRPAMADLSSPGRLQIIERNPTVLIDAAHNPAGAEALVHALKTIFPDAPIYAVVGMLVDKDSNEFLRIIEPILSAVVLTQSSSPRATPAGQLADSASEFFGAERVAVEFEVLDAVAAASAQAGVGGLVLVTGSISLVGDVLRLKSEQEEHDA